MADDTPPAETAPIPDTLRIGSYTYTVHSTTAAWCELKADVEKAHKAWGYSDVARAAMWVDPDGHDAQHVRDTVLHEVLHQCFHVTGAQGIDSDDEERVVAAIAPTLMGALRDNPELVAYLLDV